MNSALEFASTLDDDIKCLGNHNEKKGQRIINAGNLTMLYEQGNIRYLSIGQNEIIRMIYIAVRNKEWLTIRSEFFEEEYNIQHNSFLIRYCSHYKSGDIDFSAIHKIEGKPDNSLIYSFEGVANTSFDKNRIGFCVLHPIDGCAGSTCTIVHSNEDSEIKTFPRFISPHQVFVDIKSMKWKTYNYDCVLNFYGDVFETEDQRNWTDSSYKTYCTPLMLPYPVRLQKGDRINQKIEFKIFGDSNQRFIKNDERNDEIRISIYPEERFKIPLIGISKSSRTEPLTRDEIQLFNKLRFDHYRIDVYLFNSDWKIKAELAVDEAVILSYAIEFALFFDDDFLKQSTLFIDWVCFMHLDIAMIIILHKAHKTTPDLLTDTLTPLFKKALPGVRVGCGTNANFAQLNRNKPESVQHDCICYSIHPQEHASDNLTLVENLQGQKYTVDSAMNFAKGKGIWISPVNMQRRFNANIENYEQHCKGIDTHVQIDSRLMSLFGACWTVATFKYLMESGITGMTIYETVGERGIIQGNYTSCCPDKFQSTKGMIFPVYFVIANLLANKAYKIILSISSNPLFVCSLILTNGSDLKILIVNFTSYQQQVFIKDYSGRLKVKQLNIENYACAVSDSNWFENAEETFFPKNRSLLLRPYSTSFAEGKLNQLNHCV
jgi:hypothetical protein